MIFFGGIKNIFYITDVITHYSSGFYQLTNKKNVCAQTIKMNTTIKCPNCGHQFEPTDLIRDEIQKEVNSKAEEWKKKKEKELEESLRKNISSDFENKLSLLEENNKNNEEKLKLSRQKELEFLKKEQELLSKEKEIDLQLQRLLLEERNKLSEIIRKEEAEKNSLKDTEHQMRVKELEEKLEAQRKLAEEMKRKAEQGSMQTQGEVQELLLEEMLRTTFPFDIITEVGKGVRGADCIQTVRNNFGQECGKIIYESKRTKDFANDWIDKLKSDMRSQGADVAVIVTQALPRDMSSFGEKEGVWICSFAEAKAVVAMLRDAVIKIFNSSKSQENKGDKMHLLYDYLTSREFAEQWQAIREGFMSMKLSIQKERDAMERLWKAREKQLEKVLLSAAHVRGSIEGISGTDVDLNLLEDSSDADE